MTEPPQAGATSFRCGGRGAATGFAQRGQGYGRLVRSFLDQHGQCGNAVEISARGVLRAALSITFR